MIDWSIDVFPSAISPSTGIVSPGSIRRISPSLICSTGIISSWIPDGSERILLPIMGVRLIKCFNPLFDRSTVFSSKIAPMAMMKATSPAAKSSPIAMEAAIAIEISNAEEVHFSYTNRVIARYVSGYPDKIMVIQAGLKRNPFPVNRNIRLSTRNPPEKIVIAGPANKSLIFFNMICPPKLSLDSFVTFQYNKFITEHIVL